MQAWPWWVFVLHRCNFWNDQLRKRHGVTEAVFQKFSATELCLNSTIKICKLSPAQVNPSGLTFAAKFVAIYLFIRVKGSCPMTSQYLTVDMIATGKEKGGFIDQKTLTGANMEVLNGYILHVRPLLKPQSDFIFVSINGGQHDKLGVSCKWKIHSSCSLSPSFGVGQFNHWQR